MPTDSEFHPIGEAAAKVVGGLRFSINMQIEEVEREIALRKRVYPHQVAHRLMRQSIADYHLARMCAVLETLENLRDGITATDGCNVTLGA